MVDPNPINSKLDQALVFLMALKSPFGNNIILNLLFEMKKLPKCGIGTPKNQYHNFNTMFSIPRFQYHIFNTTWYSSKMRQFHEKIRQIKDSVAEFSFWRVFSWKRFCASKNTTLNSYSKPYDNIILPYGPEGGIKNTIRSPRAEGEARSPRAKGWYFWWHPRAHMVIILSYCLL